MSDDARPSTSSGSRRLFGRSAGSAGEPAATGTRVGGSRRIFGRAPGGAAAGAAAASTTTEARPAGGTTTVRGTSSTSSTSSSSSTSSPGSTSGTAVEQPVRGKGRPTPKRSEAQRRRTGPIAPPPATRKEAAQRRKAQRVEDKKAGRTPQHRQPVRELARDAGPVRAVVRDVVDARRNVAVLLMPVALGLFLITLSGMPRLIAGGTQIWLATLVAVALDSVVIGVVVRRRVRAEFPTEGRRAGHVFYALMRTIVFRRLRMPPPRVSPPRLFGSR